MFGDVNGIEIERTNNINNTQKVNYHKNLDLKAGSKLI